MPAARSLKTLDKHFGPLHIGELTITRVEMKAMGAKVNGEAMSAQNSNFKLPDQAFLDALSFNPAQVEARIKSVDTTDSSKVATLFFELACKRSTNASHLFVASEPLVAGSPMERFDNLVGSAQKIDIQRLDSLEHMPSWVNRTKSYLQSGAGVGLQAYGIYSGMLGIAEAVKVGDLGEAAFNAGAITSELGSLILEQGLTKGGEAMFRSGGAVFNRFPVTSVGKTLSRGAGLFACVITLPFDITGAVKSFNAAAASTGKEAQDHYVNGALNVASAGISVTLGLAALAGFGSAAGPLGLAAAAVLILGAEIYRAARVVDDIDDYIDLSFHQRLRSGWFAFTHQELDQDVMDRYKITKAFSDHEQILESSAKDLLAGAYKNYVEHVVNGSFAVQLRPVKIWHYQWDESVGEKPYKVQNEPMIVTTNDTVNARDGLPADLQKVVSGELGKDKGVLWRLGDGHDQIIGVKDKPNYFSYRADPKILTGGDKNDEFYFETTDTDLDRVVKPSRISVLNGGQGTDLLAFEGSRPPHDTHHSGYDVNLQTGTVTLRGGNPSTEEIPVANIQDIENISTLHLGSNRVTGSDAANRIVANGNDYVAAGAGDDTIFIRGSYCSVEGGSGADRYYIADSAVQTTIIEDGQQTSHIEFGWPLEKIQQWRIIGNSLTVTSLRGEDGELPQHTLTITNLYKEVDSQRRLNTNLLLFKTQDGYELMPTLPVLLTDTLSHDVEVIVTVKGKRPPVVDIINGGTTLLSGKEPKHYFVSRNSRRVDILAPAQQPRTSSVIYLDYKSDEIREIRASYNVDAHKGVSDFTYLDYANVNIWIFLPLKVLNLTGIVMKKPDGRSVTGSSYLTVGIHNAHDVVLILQDGKSYRLQPPRVSYANDAADPGYRSLLAWECLVPRNGQYLFNRPPAAETYLLSTKPQRIDIAARTHQGTYVLQGQSSSYDIYPASNSIINLSTPGAMANTADASTWNIFTAGMTETVARSDVRLSSQMLQVGSVVFELPKMDEDAPVESISVATSSGNIYEVSLLFKALLLYLINAQGYADLRALRADIETHCKRSELAAKVLVKNINVTPAMSGTIYYHSTHDYWGIDSDMAYRINPEDLVIDPLEKTDI